ncbi:type II secretion system protein [Dielma fastidiosa]|uniref:Uncharacterized protein n=1 Tax=Dielma fastidiosa TaxID=1034346 RepID=A0A318KRI0_9FIRM|nr:type II secretion system protein [Dielma fastidiosa]PXX80451.1 hypothetical protein DES51_10342 [Dielma fastidiosa]
MRKDKRGMALITAIAVLALMLILFGGLAMIYSSQVSRNKLEHEQSQAMLLAQSYMEMLNDVLMDQEAQQDFIKEFGSIRSNVPVEISASISEEYPKHQVKIIATAQDVKYNGNTKTRDIKVKVTVTVDDEVRSILANYTYKEVVGGALLDYAVYANKINFYSNGDKDKEGDPIIFNNSTWYKDRKGTQSIASKQLINADGYKFGGIERGNFDKIFHIKKNGEINPENDDFSGFAQAVNHADLSRSIAPWDRLSEPDESIPYCPSDSVITQSCIWNGDEMAGDITFKAVDNDIVVYVPIDDEFELNGAKIEFYNIETDETPKQLYFYAYSDNEDRVEIEFDEKSTITTINNTIDDGSNEYVDVFFICNDDLDVEFKNENEKNQLEAYFYFPKGKVKWETSKVDKERYKDENRIRGCLIAQEIMIVEKQNDSHKGYVGIDYVPPRAVQSGDSGTTSASVTLNRYEEGGKS